MNRPRAVLLMVMSLMGTSCLSAAITLTPRQVETLPASNHRWTTPTIFRPAATMPSRSVFQPHTALLNAEIVPVVAPVRHKNFTPVIVPGRMVTPKWAKFARSSTQ